MATPPKPSTAAISAMTRNVKAQPSMLVSLGWEGNAAARPWFRLRQAEEPPRVAAGNRANGRRTEPRDRRKMADRVVFAHIKGIIGAHQDTVGAEQRDQRFEL